MNLFTRLASWREARRLEQLQIPDSLWLEALGDWRAYRRLTDQDRIRLQDLALRLLLRKHFRVMDGVELSDAMHLRIAGMAALPVLHLGLQWYDGWQTLIVYDGPFVAEHSWEDEFGIVHHEVSERSGEAWERGPVVLSWEDVLASGRDGYNVVIHELAHTLDMRQSGANGAPPLHPDMDPGAWTRALSDAWEELLRRAEAGEPLPLDHYALEDPAEFFAVLSEAFFEEPEALATALPAVYRQLELFYRQSPWPLAPLPRG
jgi:MtfA peptidase